MVGGVFGIVDHLVNNAGVVLQLRLFEDFTHFSDIASVMVITSRRDCILVLLL